MNIELFMEFIDEIAEDYENYGQRKPEREWLYEAIKRHIVDVSDEEAEKIVDKLIEGVMMYRKMKEKRSELGQVAIKEVEQQEITDFK